MLEGNRAQVDLFRGLPIELIIQILSYLSPHELSETGLVNQQLNQITSDPILWKRLIRQFYPCALRKVGPNDDPKKIFITEFTKNPESCLYLIQQAKEKALSRAVLSLSYDEVEMTLQNEKISKDCKNEVFKLAAVEKSDLKMVHLILTQIEVIDKNTLAWVIKNAKPPVSSYLLNKISFAHLCEAVGRSESMRLTLPRWLYKIVSPVFNWLIGEEEIYQINQNIVCVNVLMPNYDYATAAPVNFMLTPDINQGISFPHRKQNSKRIREEDLKISSEEEIQKYSAKRKPK